MPDMMLVPKMADERMVNAAYPAFDKAPLPLKPLGGQIQASFAAMTAASPNGGKVTREMLEMAVRAVCEALEAGRSETDYGVGWTVAALDNADQALAAALGLQIEGE